MDAVWRADEWKRDEKNANDSNPHEQEEKIQLKL